MAKPTKKEAPVADPCLTPDEVQVATRKLASDLAFCAKRPVNIQLVDGPHIAYTYDTDQTKRTIPIVMNPSILGKVRNKERALRIWRGIGFHELAHHLWPASEQYKTAHKEGFRHLFNLVDDEQNERRGRAFDDSWGACFQSVCAFIFPGKNQSETILIPGIVDGDKPAKSPKGRAATKAYIKRWNSFAYHFRRHIPNCPDKIVAEALALVPKRFMDLSKEELLDLTRQIHETLSRDIILPTEDPNAPKVEKKPGDVPEPENDDDDDDDEDEEPEEEPEPEPETPPADDEKPPEDKKGLNLRKLFRSKWTYIPFGVAIALWFALLMQGGVNFWVKVFLTAVIVGGAIFTFLYLRRAMIKSMLASLKRARTIPPPGMAPTEPPRDRLAFKKRLVFGMKAVACVGIALAAFHFLPLAVAMFIISIGLCVMAGMWFLKVRVKAKTKKKEDAPGWMSVLGIIAFGILSLGGMLYSLSFLGVANLWIAIGGGLLAIGALFASLMLVNDQQAATTESGKLTTWQKCQRKIARTRDSIFGSIRGFFRAIFRAIWDFICDVIGFIYKYVAMAVVFICRIIFRSLSFCWHWTVIGLRRLRWKISGPLLKGWKHPLLRICMVALPVAIVLVILYSLIVKAGAYGWWVAVIVVLLLLLLLLLGYVFRKQIKRFVVQELFMPMPELMDASMMPPLDMTTEWFNQIDDVNQIQPDQAMLDQLLPQIYPLAQQLRPLLARCGRATIDREDQVDGHDLMEEAELALVGETAVFIDDDVTPKASVHLEVALDCSGSMSSPTASLKPGEKFLLGKFFALVLEQAVINLPGVSAHFWGFTDRNIYDCGVPGEGRISGLQCGGGNNDAAMLWHMGQSAAASGKDVKILLMLSDGQPSDCSWLSLHNLVMQFEQEGMIPWNFALDVIETPAFERFFTDLVGQSLHEAIVTMGETLAAIAEAV